MSATPNDARPTRAAQPQNAAQPSEQSVPPQPKRGFPVRLVSILVLLVLALIFIFSNLEEWTLFFLGFSFTGPAWMWFLALLVVGICIGLLIPRLGKGSDKKKR